jgi:hypothetical protein
VAHRQVAGPIGSEVPRSGVRRPVVGVTGPAGRVLQFQRSVGNQATRRLLGTHAGAGLRPTSPATPEVAVQRCGGEIHAGCPCADGSSTVDDNTVQRAPAPATAPLLTSPRFAGDATLEACRQDKARLDAPARGESVRRVQQALLDLGFELGPTGADAVYGPATSAAVKAFKKKENLGFEQFGDVGPGTMRRLDELFPAERPAPVDNDIPEADEDDGTGCPAPQAVVEAAESSPAITQALVRSAPDQVGAPQAPPPAADPIARAVESFKQKADIRSATGALDGTPNMTDAGQFVFAARLRDVITKKIAAIEKAGDPDAKAYAVEARKAVDAAMKRDDKVDTHIANCLRIAETTSSSMNIDMLVLVRKVSVAGGTIDARLFAALEASATDTLPETEFFPFRTLRALKVLAAFDAKACGGHAVRMAQRVLRKGGLVPRKKNGAAVSAVLASGGGFNDMRPMENLTSTREPAATQAVKAKKDALLLGDVISQTGAGAAAAQMRRALTDGRLVHARVVSGEGYGAPGTSVGKIDPKTKKRVDEPADIAARRHPIGKAPQEHSLLIIGFDGDKFVFHDPDAGVSTAGGERGFGLLFFDSTENRLSTAKNPGDMLVDQTGKHDAAQHGAHDKRYQVITLASL